VCNVALDFSNLCTPLVEAGLTHALCGVLGSMLPELRFKALWALKNLAFACEPALQQQLLRELPWGVFRDLLMGDDDPRVRTQAAGLLQNLCKGGDDLEQVKREKGGGGGGAGRGCRRFLFMGGKKGLHTANGCERGRAIVGES
jgi:hypothetical protein